MSVVEKYFTCGILIPVRNEEKVLPKTVPALLAAVEGERARVIWVCNACSDRSAEVIRQLSANRGEVVEIATPGKTLALQVGDELLDEESIFPRLYLDADTWLRPGDVGRLFQPLRRGEADLVAASHAYDYTNSSFVSRMMARRWLTLPFARDAAFLRAVAVSRNGRSRWAEWPSVIADDMFMAGKVSPEKRRMVYEAVATTWVPSTFSEWVSMRARWLRGERQVVEMGLSLPSAPKQRVELAKRLFDPRTSIGALAFCMARLLAIPKSKKNTGTAWNPLRQTKQTA